MGPDLLLDARSIHKSFGAVQALAGASLQVQQREIVALIGPNGSGKTTMLNCVSGFHSIDTGEVIWQGRPVTGWSPQRLARHGLVRTFQHVAVFPELTTASCLARASDCRKAIGTKAASNPKIPEDVGTLIDMCQLRANANDRVGDLAYGLQRLVNVAMAVITRPLLLMLDEPAGRLVEDGSRSSERLAPRGQGSWYLGLHRRPQHAVHIVHVLPDRRDRFGAEPVPGKSC